MVFGPVKDAVTDLMGSAEERHQTVLPTDDEVVEQASGRADIDVDRVAELTEAVQDVLDQMYGKLEEEAVIADEQDGRSGQDPEDGFLYGFRATDDILVIGGAGGVLEGIGERLGLAHVETDVVREAHRIAANTNGYARHVVMDDIVIARDRHIREASEGLERDRGDVIADAVEELTEDGYPIPGTRVLAQLDLEDQKYFGVTVTFADEGVTLTLDPTDRSADHHGVVSPDGDVHVSRDIGCGLALGRRDVSWHSTEGALEARFSPLAEEIPGGRQTKLVERDSWQGHLPQDVVRRSDAEPGDDVCVAADGRDGKQLLVVDVDDQEDDAIGLVTTSGVGNERTIVELPEAVADVVGLDRGNVNVAWDVVDGHIIGTMMG